MSPILVLTRYRKIFAGWLDNILKTVLKTNPMHQVLLGRTSLSIGIFLSCQCIELGHERKNYGKGSLNLIKHLLSCHVSGLNKSNYWTLPPALKTQPTRHTLNINNINNTMNTLFLWSSFVFLKECFHATSFGFYNLKSKNLNSFKNLCYFKVSRSLAIIRERSFGF